jgi:hypothetical protein
MSMKNSNDTTGNRTGDLPAFSAVPQTTAPPRTPLTENINKQRRRQKRGYFQLKGKKPEVFSDSFK